MIRKVWAVAAATLLGAALAVGLLAAPAVATVPGGGNTLHSTSASPSTSTSVSPSASTSKPATTSPSASVSKSTSRPPSASASASTAASTATQLPVTGSSASALFAIGVVVFAVGATLLLFGVAARRRRVTFRSPE